MFNGFTGISVLSLDAKGRIAVPARHRERLQVACDSKLTLTIDREACLLLYPQPNWEEFEARLSGLPAFKPAARAMQRIYLGHAEPVEIDGQGRLLLPPALRSYAGLGKRIAFVGQGNRFEIWDEETWNGKRDEWRDEASFAGGEVPAEFQSFSL